jgi:Ca2+-binding EF-hand superfamily protein
MIDLSKELSLAMKEIKSEIMDRLFLVLDNENKGAVSEFEFYTVMKPWASFSATDINNDNELDAMELKTLIWLIDEEEPLESRVQRDLKIMDRDGSGTIDRLEWIQFLASPDPTVIKWLTFIRLDMKCLISILRNLSMFMTLTKMDRNLT